MRAGAEWVTLNAAVLIDHPRGGVSDDFRNGGQSDCSMPRESVDAHSGGRGTWRTARRVKLAQESRTLCAISVGREPEPPSDRARARHYRERDSCRAPRERREA